MRDLCVQSVGTLYVVLLQLLLPIGAKFQQNPSLGENHLQIQSVGYDARGPYHATLPTKPLHHDFSCIILASEHIQARKSGQLGKIIHCSTTHHLGVGCPASDPEPDEHSHSDPIQHLRAIHRHTRPAPQCSFVF